MDSRTLTIKRRRAVLAIVLASMLAGIGVADGAPRPFGDARVLAKVPTPPGFPEGIAVRQRPGVGLRPGHLRHRRPGARRRCCSTTPAPARC